MILRRRIMVLGGGDSGGYVDLGLPSGLAWAKGNLVKDSHGNYSIGAETDWGTYVSWGNIIGNNEGEGYNFSDTNYNNTSGSTVVADIPSNDAAHDIALATLGTPWHLPTKKDFQELYDNTDSEWVADYNGTGVAGRKFMKKSDHSIYVFFPASGNYGNTSRYDRGKYGYYWSSSFFSATYAYYLFFSSSLVSPQEHLVRRGGLTVRPVCKAMYSITITLEGEDVEGITVTVRDSEGISHSGITNSNGVVRLTGVACGSAKVSANGYYVLGGDIQVNASNKSFTCGLAPLGVWAYYSDGSLKSESEADTNAIGVAVLTANCGFVIDKLATNSNIRFGGYNKDLSRTGIVVTDDKNTARLDFDGDNNTTKIINDLSGYNDGYSTGAPACEACRAAFGGNGYMGSLGEWNEAYYNKSSIDSMMTKIGGTAIATDYHWASTLRSSSSYQWMFSWRNGDDNSSEKSIGRYARAFRAL